MFFPLLLSWRKQPPTFKKIFFSDTRAEGDFFSWKIFVSASRKPRKLILNFHGLKFLVLLYQDPSRILLAASYIYVLLIFLRYPQRRLCRTFNFSILNFSPPTSSHFSLLYPLIFPPISDYYFLLLFHPTPLFFLLLLRSYFLVIFPKSH